MKKIATFYANWMFYSPWLPNTLSQMRPIHILKSTYLLYIMLCFSVWEDIFQMKFFFWIFSAKISIPSSSIHFTRIVISHNFFHYPYVVWRQTNHRIFLLYCSIQSCWHFLLSMSRYPPCNRFFSKTFSFPWSLNMRHKTSHSYKKQLLST